MARCRPSGGRSPRAPRRGATGVWRSADAREGSPVVVERGVEPGLADLLDESPDVGLRAVDVGEPVFAREPAGVDRLLVPPRPVGIRRQRDDGTTDVSRGLRE